MQNVKQQKPNKKSNQNKNSGPNLDLRGWKAISLGHASGISGSGHSLSPTALTTVFQNSGIGRAPLLVKSPPAMRETRVQSLGWKIPWRRELVPTPVFWPGEFPGLCSPWGCKELETTEWLSLSITSQFKKISEYQIQLLFMNSLFSNKLFN